MEPLRVANCSGFYGDRLSAAREMVDGGPIDVLTGDYLAELTMLILWKGKMKDPSAGFAKTFLRQMEQILGTCIDRGIRVVTNAGGLNPRSLAEKLRELASTLGLDVDVAHIEGDDLLPKIGDLIAAGHPLAHMDTGKHLGDAGWKPITANAYLGAWGIAEALAGGADVVVCPRVTDASLVVGPAAWHFGWARDDWDALAGAVVAGHVLECGAQATGGNYAFFREVPDLTHPGFPIAEMHADGSSVITKHPGTGGLVSVGTVTAQLLYEIAGPAYLNPDVVARFDTIRLAQDGPDRVRISGVRGEPAPRTTKVCVNYVAGFRNTMTFLVTGLDIEEKAELARETLFRSLGGEAKFDEVDVRLLRTDHADARTNAEASAQLRITVKAADPSTVGRAFSSAAIEMALASYPGFTTTAPPGDGTPYGVFWPCLVPAEVVEHVLVRSDGTIVPVDLPPAGEANPVAPPNVAPSDHSSGPEVRAPLGLAFGARSGDKGGNANLGIWARSDEAYAWLARSITIARLRELLPEIDGLDVQRFELPNLRALNFVIVGLLGEGVAASTRPDPQAKSLGEFLRARVVEIPGSLISPDHS